MTLTLDHGPLSGKPPAEANYAIEGPAHRLLMTDFPRRIRAELAGETVLDSTRAKLLHETGILPQLYVPAEDLQAELLAASHHSTHCPFKGDARYWSLHAGERVAENAVWAYPEPIDGASWLRGYRGVYWDRVDRWLDEDEPVEGHLRDPYHRVDVRPSSRRVRVLVAGAPVAETRRAMVLSENGLPNRWYVPPEDVRMDLLAASDKRTVCPYKGTASYWSTGEVEDAAWTYAEPLPGEAQRIAGMLSFLGGEVTVEVED